VLHEQVHPLNHYFNVKIEKADAKERTMESAPTSPDIPVDSEIWEHISVTLL
jgi:hypothetical protein